MDSDCDSDGSADSFHSCCSNATYQAKSSIPEPVLNVPRPPRRTIVGGRLNESPNKKNHEQNTKRRKEDVNDNEVNYSLKLTDRGTIVKVVNQPDVRRGNVPSGNERNKNFKNVATRSARNEGVGNFSSESLQTYERYGAIPKIRSERHGDSGRTASESVQTYERYGAIPKIRSERQGDFGRASEFDQTYQRHGAIPKTQSQAPKMSERNKDIGRDFSDSHQTYERYGAIPKIRSERQGDFGRASEFDQTYQRHGAIPKTQSQVLKVNKRNKDTAFSESHQTQESNGAIPKVRSDATNSTERHTISENTERKKSPKPIVREESSVSSRRGINGEVSGRHVAQTLGQTNETNEEEYAAQSLLSMEAVEQPETRYFRILNRRREGFVKPIRKLYSLPLSKPIMDVLRHHVKDLFPIVTYSVPSILSRQSTVMIGKPASGKTLGYVLPLMEILTHLNDTRQLEQGYGPIAIVVCPGFLSASKVQEYCRKYGNFNCRFGMATTRIALVHGGNEKTKWNELARGCELLITTAHSLIRVLKDQLLTNLDRLQFIVLEDSDRLLQPPFDAQIRILRERCRRVEKLRQIQWIIVGEELTSRHWPLLKHINDYTLLVASHLEAALYGLVKPTIAVISKEKKIEKLIEMLKGKMEKEKIVVVCNEKIEAVQIVNAMYEKISVLVAYTDMSVADLQGIAQDWQERAHPILVCTDSVLEDLAVFDATFLVHFSIPSRSKTQFGSRFSTLMDNYRNHFHPEKSTRSVSCALLLDHEVQRPIPHLVKMLKRLGSTIPESFLQFSENISRLVQEGKPLCPSLLSRGVCVIKSCDNRHFVMQEKDSCLDPRVQGLVVFQPLAALDGSCFTAKLISSEDADGNCHTFEDHRENIGTVLRRHFANRERSCIMPIADVTEGALCAVKNLSGEYYRGKVEDIGVLDRFGQPKAPKVRLIDVGNVHVIKVNDLWELPAELKEIPGQAVSIYIAGLQPFDSDKDWNYESWKTLETAVARPLADLEWWQGTVALAFRHGVVMDRISVLQRLPNVGATVTEMVLVDTLLKTAEKNEKHLERLLEVAAPAGIKLAPKPEKRDRPILPTWAHFGQEEMPAVKFTCATSSKQIFLLNAKFSTQQKEMDDLCAVEARKMIATKKKFRVKAGDFCIAKNESNEWGRAKVESIDDDNGSICYFLDYGDRCYVPLQDIVHMPTFVVTKLPFQAIECKLGGVKHPDPCPPSIVDAMFQFTDEGAESCFACVVKHPEDKPATTGGHLFTINLLNSRGLSLNKQLVDEGILEVDEGEGAHEFLHDVDIIAPDVPDDADDENDTENWMTRDREDDADYWEKRDLRRPIDEPKLVRDEEVANFLSLITEGADSEEMAMIANFFKDLTDDNMNGDRKTNGVLALKDNPEDGSKNDQEQKDNPEMGSKTDQKQKAENRSKTDEEQTDNPENRTKTDQGTAADRLLPTSKSSEEDTTTNEICNDVEKTLSTTSNAKQEEEHGEFQLAPDLVYPPGLRPKTYWRQDFYTLYITLEIFNVETYEVSGHHKYYCVTCIDKAGNKYRASNFLYFYIFYKNMQIHVTPLGVRLTIPKVVPSTWPRLRKATTFDPMLAIHPDADLEPEPKRETYYFGGVSDKDDKDTWRIDDEEIDEEDDPSFSEY